MEHIIDDSNAVAKQKFQIINDMKVIKKIVPSKNISSAPTQTTPWPNSKSLMLIRLYRDRPSLWDPSDSKYRDKKCRRECLNEISVILGSCVEDVERKIHGLRTQFLRECRRHFGNSTWFAYEALKFLHGIRNIKQESEMEKVVYKVCILK